MSTVEHSVAVEDENVKHPNTNTSNEVKNTKQNEVKFMSPDAGTPAYEALAGIIYIIFYLTLFITITIHTIHLNIYIKILCNIFSKCCH